MDKLEEKFWEYVELLIDDGIDETEAKKIASERVEEEERWPEDPVCPCNGRGCNSCYMLTY